MASTSAATAAGIPIPTSNDLLLKYVFNNQITPNSYKKADLLKLAVDKGRKNNGQLKLVVDVESCWDKLVGCSKKDLALTPWQLIHAHLQQLLQISTNSNLELMFMFNGTSSRRTSTPPAFILESILLTLRALGVQCRSTVDHHEIELIKFVAKFNLHGVITSDTAFVAWNDGLDVKIWYGMKFKGGGVETGPQWRGKPALESHELCIEIVLDHLKMEKPRFLLLTKLLIDPTIGLELIQYSWTTENSKTQTLPPALIDFIKGLGAIDAKSVETALQHVIQKPELKIHEAIVKYRQPAKKKEPASTRVTGARPSPEQMAGTASKTEPNQSQTQSASASAAEAGNDVTSKLKSIKINCSSNSTDSSFLVSPMLVRLKEEIEEEPTATTTAPPQPQSSEEDFAVAAEHTPFPGLERDIDNILSESPYEDNDHDHEADDAEEEQPDEPEAGVQPESKPEAANGRKDGPGAAPTQTTTTSTNPSTSGTSSTGTGTVLLKPSRKVESIAFTRHTTGLMHPAILQLYQTNTFQLPFSSPSAAATTTDPNKIFAVLRAKMYATLFNSNHMKFLGRPVTIKIKEFSQGRESEASAVEVGWQIPTVERLWLGDDCKPKRIRAFFSITNSERQSLLNADIVPQRVLVLVVALRYIVSAREPVLQRSELDAFLIQSILVSLDPRAGQGHSHRNAPPAPPRVLNLIQLLSTALVHLHVLNDAVGAPIPYQLFIPSQFFDGNTFTRVLAQLVRQTPAEICGPGLVLQMERLRIAVLDGLRVKFMERDGVDLQQRLRPLFKQPLLPTAAVASSAHFRARPQIPVQSMYAGLPGLMFSNGPRPRQTPPAYYAATAGQLHVAGQVVGQWGPNKPSVHTNGCLRGTGTVTMISRNAGSNWGLVSRNPSAGGFQQQQDMGYGAKKKGPVNKKKNKKPVVASTTAAAGTSGNSNEATATTPATATPPVQITIKAKPTTPPSPSAEPRLPGSDQQPQIQIQATDAN